MRLDKEGGKGEKIRYTVGMLNDKAGFREKEHTADWELEVWAPTLSELVEQAARGMYALSGTSLSSEQRTHRNFMIHFRDPEYLLVHFLSELLFLGEEEGLGFDCFELTLDGNNLLATVWGAPILTQEKEIKAVTYHNLIVQDTGSGKKVNLVFDV